MEIVIVSVDHDEKMAKALDLLEHMEIHRLVTQRASKRVQKTVPMEAVLKEQETLKRFQLRRP